MDENIMVKCPRCGAKNRVPRERINQRPICGRCKAPLKKADFPAVPVDITDQTFNREVLSFSGPCGLLGPMVRALQNGRTDTGTVGLRIR